MCPCIRCNSYEDLRDYKHKKREAIGRTRHYTKVLVSTFNVPTCPKCHKAFTTWKIIHAIVLLVSFCSWAFFVISVVVPLVDIFVMKNDLFIDAFVFMPSSTIFLIIMIIIILLVRFSKSNPNKYIKVVMGSAYRKTPKRAKTPKDKKISKIPDFNKYIVLAAEYSENRNFKKSIECWKKVVKIKPDHSTAWVMMGQEYEKLQQGDQALKCYDHALKINPRDVDAEWYKSILLEAKSSSSMEHKMIKCQKCGAKMEKTVKYCGECGTPIV